MTIDIYTKVTCFYCMKAKALLEQKQLKFNEIKIDNDAQLREQMISLSGGATTVPQIFIAEQHIGGCDDLYSLHATDQLDSLLANG